MMHHKVEDGQTIITVVATQSKGGGQCERSDKKVKANGQCASVSSRVVSESIATI